MLDAHVRVVLVGIIPSAECSHREAQGFVLS
jgi:G:T/U-mismatch repair DNA glycosylase